MLIIEWLNRAQCERQRRLAEEVIKDQVTKVGSHSQSSIENLTPTPQRILEKALSHWTNRVIEIKLRELEIGQQREARLQTYVPKVFPTMYCAYSLIDRLALKKWRDACARHAEELSLMESYQLVKREGTFA